MSVFSEIDTMKNIDVEEEENVMVLPRSDNSVSTNEPLTPEVLSEPSKEEKVKTPEVSSEEKDEEKVQMTEIKVEDVPNINYDDFKPIISFDNVSEDEIVDTALNRLAQDTYFGINGLPLIACFLHIYNRAKTDINFSKQVLIKSKNFSKAFDYLTKQVKSMSGGNRGVGLDHRQIFAILDDYYDLDDAAIAEKEAEAKQKSRLNLKPKRQMKEQQRKLLRMAVQKRVLLSLIRKLRKRKKNLLICFHCWEVVTNVAF